MDLVLGGNVRFYTKFHTFSENVQRETIIGSGISIVFVVMEMDNIFILFVGISFVNLGSGRIDCITNILEIIQWL